MIRNLPWRAIRHVIKTIRKTFFSVTVDGGILVDTEIQNAKEALLDEHFEDSWYLSYHYNGEDENLRRPDGEDEAGQSRQFHVRLFEEGSQTRVMAHREYSPIQHPKLHLEEKRTYTADKRAADLIRDD